LASFTSFKEKLEKTMFSQASLWEEYEKALIEQLQMKIWYEVGAKIWFPLEDPIRNQIRKVLEER